MFVAYVGGALVLLEIAAFALVHHHTFYNTNKNLIKVHILSIMNGFNLSYLY